MSHIVPPSSPPFCEIGQRTTASDTARTTARIPIRFERIQLPRIAGPARSVLPGIRQIISDNAIKDMLTDEDLQAMRRMVVGNMNVAETFRHNIVPVVRSRRRVIEAEIIRRG